MRLEELTHAEIDLLQTKISDRPDLVSWLASWDNTPLQPGDLEALIDLAEASGLSRASSAIRSHAELVAQKPSETSSPKPLNYVTGEDRERAEACLESLRRLLSAELKRGKMDGVDLGKIKDNISSLELVLKFASFGGKIPWPVSEPSLSCFRENKVEHLIHPPWSRDDFFSRRHGEALPPLNRLRND